MLLMRPSKFVLSLMVALAPDCRAFSYNDCIINGMRGVSSDAAANAVRVACLAKKKEYEGKPYANFVREYGEVLEKRLYEINSGPLGSSSKKSDWKSKNFRNISSSTTIRYIELVVWVPSGGYCWYSTDAKRYIYTGRIKPMSSMRLAFPPPTEAEGGICVDVRDVRGVPSSTWEIGSLSDEVLPVDKDPYPR